MIGKFVSYKGEFSKRDFGLALIAVSLAAIFQVFLLILLDIQARAAETGTLSSPFINLLLSALGLVLSVLVPYVVAVSMIKRLRFLGRSGWLSLTFWALFFLNVFSHGQWIFTGLPAFRVLFILSILGIVLFLGWLMFSDRKSVAEEKSEPKA